MALQHPCCNKLLISFGLHLQLAIEQSELKDIVCNYIVLVCELYSISFVDKFVKV
jgi:hypothetical protein